jgi:hypothetical protein
MGFGDRSRLCVLAVAATFVGGCLDSSGLAAGVTRAGILEVKLGMDEHQVQAILGPPVSTTEERELPGGYRCKPSQCPPGVGTVSRVAWAYSRKTGTLVFPMLWVHFREGRVNSVYGKRYSFFDSEGVYLLTEEKHWIPSGFASTFPR